MKKGFTMIELIFVIVILGILAAVAIPKLAATRDDARLAAIKTDIGTAMQAVPAWYQGQKDARILEAIGLDTKQWIKGTGEEYLLTLDDEACVTIAVWDVNSSTDVGSVAVAADINVSNGRWIDHASRSSYPLFRVINQPVADSATPTGICATLWNEMGVTEQNITMAGRKVQW